MGISFLLFSLFGIIQGIVIYFLFGRIKRLELRLMGMSETKRQKLIDKLNVRRKGWMK